MARYAGRRGDKCIVVGTVASARSTLGSRESCTVAPPDSIEDNQPRSHFNLLVERKGDHSFIAPALASMQPSGSASPTAVPSSAAPEP